MRLTVKCNGIENLYYGTLEEIKEEAKNDMVYSQENVMIYQGDNLICISRWRGTPYEENDDYGYLTSFGDFGYYEEWEGWSGVFDTDYFLETMENKGYSIDYVDCESDDTFCLDTTSKEFDINDLKEFEEYLDIHNDDGDEIQIKIKIRNTQCRNQYIWI